MIDNRRLTYLSNHVTLDPFHRSHGSVIPLAHRQKARLLCR